MEASDHETLLHLSHAQFARLATNALHGALARTTEDWSDDPWRVGSGLAERFYRAPPQEEKVPCVGCVADMHNFQAWRSRPTLCSRWFRKAARIVCPIG
jgi:hypothetical protein